tara:strand:+ start:211 stop:456 length:246 start_codon:yes stop_codon:yes gene_type:complete
MTTALEKKMMMMVTMTMMMMMMMMMMMTTTMMMMMMMMSVSTLEIRFCEVPAKTLHHRPLSLHTLSRSPLLDQHTRPLGYP